MSLTKENVFCSIIIPSFNSMRTIEPCLASLRGMKKSYPHEIIVIDSSRDETPDYIREHYPEVNLIHLEEQTYPGSGRNLGMQHARGNLFIFVDSDCVVDELWMDKMVEAHLAYDYAAITGGVDNGTPKNLVGTTGYLIEFNEWTSRTKPRETKNILGGNVSYKREIIEKHDLSYTDVFPSEDTIFAWHLHAAGEKIFFVPDIIVYHLNRTDFKILLKHQRTLGKASAQARRITGHYGKIFVKFPFLAAVLPLVRFSRALMRVLQQDLKTVLIFLGISPLYILCSFLWSLGFVSKGDFKETKINFKKDK